MHRCKLLIIDDNPAWLYLAVEVFSSKRYKIYTAESCSAGLKQFYSHKPDCVLLDYCLPDACAPEFCRQVRAGEKIGHTPILIISGESSWEMEAYTVCQADAFVEKDDNFDKNRAAVEMIMRRLFWERGIIEEGDIRLERAGLQVFRYSKPVVRLSPHQFQLFYLLLHVRRGTVIREYCEK